MQEYRDDELIKTKLLDIEADKRTGENSFKPVIPNMGQDSTHQVIGKMPTPGDTITLNGLVYKIISADFIRGIFKAKIKRPDKNKKGK